MEREQATLDLITRTFAVGGLVLVVLVGVIAWVVTRQVVSPVRRAAVVAERLSSGRLNERMRARGEDDLARLAKSFNEMADSLQNQIRQLEGLSRVQQRFVSDVSHELRTPADDDPDGRRPHPRRAPRLRPHGGALGRAAAQRAGPLRGAARRPAGDQPVRRGRRCPRGATSSTCGTAWPGPSSRPSRSPSAGAADHGGGARRLRRRGRRPAGAAHPAQPRRQRRRARRGSPRGDRGRRQRVRGGGHRA